MRLRGLRTLKQVLLLETAAVTRPLVDKANARVWLKAWNAQRVQLNDEGAPVEGS